MSLVPLRVFGCLILCLAFIGPASAARFISEWRCTGGGWSRVDGITYEWPPVCGWHSREDSATPSPSPFVSRLPSTPAYPSTCREVVRDLIANRCSLADTTDFSNFINSAPPNSAVGFLRAYAASTSVRAHEARGLVIGFAGDRFRDPHNPQQAYVRANQYLAGLCSEEARNNPPVHHPAMDRTPEYWVVPESTTRCWRAQNRLIAETGGPLDTELLWRQRVAGSLGGLVGTSLEAVDQSVLVQIGQALVGWMQVFNIGTAEAPQDSIHILETEVSRLLSCKQLFDQAMDTPCPV